MCRFCYSVGVLTIIFDYSFANTGRGGIFSVKHAVHILQFFLKKIFRQYSCVFYINVLWLF